MTSSPYINHFIQPDTIIPNPADPQSLNRFSYVQNNPIRYTDPTGHKRVEDIEGGGPCSKRRDCIFIIHNVVKPKVAPKNMDLEGMFKDEELLGSWDGTVNISLADFEKLLEAIGDDVYSNNYWWITAANYDTPFFDRGSFLGIGKLSGTGCIFGECYDRSEINYVGVGELLASLGVDKEEGHRIVEAWKHKGCAPVGFHGESICLNPAAYNQPTAGTLKMFNLGFDYYNEHYPPKP